ncbi:MAG: DNA repair ATPase [Acidobacteriota bacterium]
MSTGVEAPSVDSGSYELIRQRLEKQGQDLRGRTTKLNERRLQVFGGTELAILGNERIRTENTCVPRDIVGIGDLMVFGFDVFVGLRSTTKLDDVFTAHRFVSSGEDDGGLQLEKVDADFLRDPRLEKDFEELYRYYRNARLEQLRLVEGKLLAIFRTGNQATDLKVFRWRIERDGRLRYEDARGERDNVRPPSHDFEWTETTREQHVRGRHPHVSIEDAVFVECVGGDLTIKVEDNTEDGQGIYREPVDDDDQALQDADILYARRGTLILLKILPYNEEVWRYFVFDTRSETVRRIDAIGLACVTLPEDHGIIFPGGYFLRGGESKSFEVDTAGLRLSRVLRSPNGEDVLHVFFEPDRGRYVLLSYNLIRKEVANPILCHGYSNFPDGRMAVFRATSQEPTRVHPLQVWQTAYCSDEHQARRPSTGSALERIGNADLVRGISDVYGTCRLIENQEPTQATYEDLIGSVGRTLDAYHWLGDEESGDLQSVLESIRDTAELVIDEFEKVQELRTRARREVAKARDDLSTLVSSLRPDFWESVDPFVEALDALRLQRGHLISLKELRQVDHAALDELEAEVVSQSEALTEKTVEFLLQDDALAPYHRRIDTLSEQIGQLKAATEATPLKEETEAIGRGLDLLAEIVAGLEVDDPTLRTRILQAISEVVSRLNATRAELEAARLGLAKKEGSAEFGAQFALFSQSVVSSLSRCDTPEACDEQLTRLLLQLEELEGRFAEFDEFLDELSLKREEVQDALASRKDTLLQDRQRRASRLLKAADRVLAGIARRAQSLTELDELNAYFASDPMIAKLRDQATKLRELGDSVKADEIEGRLSAARDEAQRSLRDRTDLHEDGGAVIRFGQHRFSVNRQTLDLALVPRGDGMAYHLTGTDFHETLVDEAFEATRPYWDQTLVSETDEVARAEHLAADLLAAAEEGRGTSLHALQEARASEGGLQGLVREAASERHEEGYERGVHDHDAALVLEKLLHLIATAGLLQYSPRVRARALLVETHGLTDDRRRRFELAAQSLTRLRASHGTSQALEELRGGLVATIEETLREWDFELSSEELEVAGRYLLEELSRHPRRITASADAVALLEAFAHGDGGERQRKLAEELRAFADDPSQAFRLARAWLDRFAATDEQHAARRAFAEEAAFLLLVGSERPRDVSSAPVHAVTEGMLSQHGRIQDRRLEIQLDEFLLRTRAHRTERVPGYRAYQAARHELLEKRRAQLRLDELIPKTMSGFVRNRLIDEVYLPMVGANFAKQLGAAGEGRRTDQMGLLLLISPPGYGKTMLMEYVAATLGLIFVKVNGPALGHHVVSLDPGSAPDATSRQELEKLNLALEMGNNVLLYLDDIQHVSAEFLQKFISLCDAQRKIEGVWNGRTRTHDLRGKKFSVVMAGNPYTESGEKFQVPDMLANRADVYNLGDVLSGRDDIFALSFLENAMTSNAALRPLARNGGRDLGALVRRAQGEEVPESDLTQDYSAVELADIEAVLQRLLKVREVVLAVNAEYIRSASQDDAFRTEPRFQLQGSYRNMNKMAERVLPIMNDGELQALIDDHYRQESQTLTSGAEQNLLKLSEIRGTMTEDEEARWREVKRSFQRLQVGQADDDDPVSKVTAQLGLLSERVSEIAESLQAPRTPTTNPDLLATLERLDTALTGLGESAAGDERPATPASLDVSGITEALGPIQSAIERLANAGSSTERPPLAEELAPLTDRLAAALEAGSAAPPPAPTLDLDPLVTELRQLAEGLPALVSSAAPSTSSAPPTPVAGAAGSGPGDLQPLLHRLDKSLQSLSRMQQGAERGRRLSSAVHELLGQHVTEVEGDLQPLLHDLAQRLKKGTAAKNRQLLEAVDRALLGFDRVKDLTDALRKGDGKTFQRARKPPEEKKA